MNDTLATARKVPRQQQMSWHIRVDLVLDDCISRGK